MGWDLASALMKYFGNCLSFRSTGSTSVQEIDCTKISTAYPKRLQVYITLLVDALGYA